MHTRVNSTLLLLPMTHYLATSFYMIYLKCYISVMFPGVCAKVQMICILWIIVNADRVPLIWDGSKELIEFVFAINSCSWLNIYFRDGERERVRYALQMQYCLRQYICYRACVKLPVLRRPNYLIWPFHCRGHFFVTNTLPLQSAHPSSLTRLCNARSSLKHIYSDIPKNWK